MKKFFLMFLLASAVILGVTAFSTRGDSTVSPSPGTGSDTLSPTAGYAVLIDERTGEVLFDKNSSKKCYPASTTKIMTALMVLENASLDETVVVGDEANMAALDSSKAWIQYGESLSVKQLLNAMLIPSGNDAAYTLAVYIGRKLHPDKIVSYKDAVSYFCRAMTERAKELGCKDTQFTNPDGYHKEDHYTTAYDMALIAKEAMTYEDFRKIVETTEYNLPDIAVLNANGESVEQSRAYYNTNRLIMPGDIKYLPSCTGLKTGHTDDAGYCLVASAYKNGTKLISVVMKSTEESVWDDSANLLKWGFNQP